MLPHQIRIKTAPMLPHQIHAGLERLFDALHSRLDVGVDQLAKPGNYVLFR